MPYKAARTQIILKEASDWKLGTRFGVMEMTAALGFEQYGLLMTRRSLKNHFEDARVYANTIMQVGAMVSLAWVLHLPGYRNTKSRIFSLVRQSINEHRSHEPGEHQAPDNH